MSAAVPPVAGAVRRSASCSRRRAGGLRAGYRSPWPASQRRSRQPPRIRAHAATAATAAGSAADRLTVTADNGGVLAPGRISASRSPSPTRRPRPTLRGTVALWIDPTPQTSRAGLDHLADVDGCGRRTPPTLGQARLGALEPGTSTVVAGDRSGRSLPFAAPHDLRPCSASAPRVTAGSGRRRSAAAAWSGTRRPGGTRSSVGVVMPIVSPVTGRRTHRRRRPRDLHRAERRPHPRARRARPATPTVAVGIDPMIIASIRVLGNAAPASATDWLVRLADAPERHVLARVRRCGRSPGSCRAG